MKVEEPFRPAEIEAVPPATEQATLVFSAAVSGVLREIAPRVRVTILRVLTRSGRSYFQQTAPYAGGEALDHSRSGRVFSFSTGIMGLAVKNKQVARTRIFPSLAELENAIEADMRRVGDPRALDQVARSYLAIPMLGATGSAVTTLYADAMQPNVFDNKKTVALIVAMCDGFCRVADQLSESPIAHIENFSIEIGTPVKDNEDVYDNVQELLPDIKVPQFDRMDYLNFQFTRY